MSRQTPVDAPLHTYLTRFCVMFVVISIMSWAHRYFEIKIFATASEFGWHFNTSEGLDPALEYMRLYWREITVGLKADLLFSVIAAFLLLPLGRIGAIVSILILSVFYAANLEHIRYNDSSIDLAFLGLAMDPNFVKGQTTPNLIKFMIAFAGLGLGMLFCFRFRLFRRLALLAAPILALGFGVPATANLEQPIWVQSHPLAPQLGKFTAEVNQRDFKPGPLASNNPAIQSFAGQYNVLLVFIEGISEYSLTKADMTQLQALAKNNIHFKQFFGHQMITANGLYAALTGLQPNITGVTMRWTAMTATSDDTKAALPWLLRDAGYQTAFLQSAPLAYMNKGEKLPYLGYEIVKGEEHFEKAYRRNGWGVDDLTLVESTLAQIDSFDPDAPWLTTILTSGTHSPYNLPDTFEPDATNQRVRAIRYADHAIAALMRGLEERELLDETVLIITSDEARETAPGSALASEILRNWLPLVVIHPDQTNVQVDQAFSMVDLRNLILMLTGEFDKASVQALVAQREVFIFGNVRLDRVFYFDRPAEALLACNTDDFVCNEYQNAKDLRQIDAMKLVGAGQFPRLQSLVLQYEDGAAICVGDPAKC